MARPDTLIDEMRTKVARLGAAFDDLAGVKRRYVALGGAAFLKPYFEQPDPSPDAAPGATVPRTDLDITPEDIPNALATLQAVEALLAQGHMTNLAKLIR